jgi:hypothetical protein
MQLSSAPLRPRERKAYGNHKKPLTLVFFKYPLLTLCPLLREKCFHCTNSTGNID